MAKQKKRNIKAQLPKQDTRNAPMRKVSGVRGFSEENKHWYDLPKETVGSALRQIIIQIDLNNKDITTMFDIYANMYGSYENAGFNNSGADAMTYDGSTNVPSYNVIQSTVDTLASKITKDNPKPVFITSGADYDTKLKAEKQTQFIQGVFQETNFYDILNNQVFRDGALFGIGAIKWKISKKNKVVCEWVFVDDIKIDRVDAMKKTPRSIHLCSLVQKEMLLADYPDKEQELDSLSSQHPEYFRSRDTVVEFMVITESWHLENGEKEGRHVVACDEVVLVDEEYNEDYFPVVFFVLYNKPTGIYGRGVADTLYSNQIEINKCLLMLQQIQELQASPLILVPNGAQVSADVLLSNNIARMVPYAGMQPPTFLSPGAGAPELYEHMKWWIMASYQEFGISLTSAAGTKQPGVDSAIAMRTMVDIESGRFIQISKNWEKFVVDNASVAMKLGKKAYEKDNSFTVKYVDKKSKIIKEIPWNKINVPDDQFVIQIDTSSSFPSSFAGRISTIMDMFTSGIFSQPRTLEMLGMDPDLDEEYRRQTSSLRLCEKRLSSMVEDKKYYHPEPFMDLKLAQKVSEMVYNQLVIDECPEERLQLVRQWIQELVTMQGGQDPLVMQLQSIFQEAQAPKVAPQGGLNPANVAGQAAAPQP
jgi:hypothetical protein